MGRSRFGQGEGPANSKSEAENKKSCKRENSYAGHVIFFRPIRQDRLDIQVLPSPAGRFRRGRNCIARQIQTAEPYAWLANTCESR